MTGRRNDTIDAFGSIVYQTGSLENDYQYQTKEYDSQSGLVYFGARYYDPSIGRFTTADPLGMVDGPNVYIYCSNNPIGFVDPWGMCKGKIDLSGMASGFVAGGLLLSDDATVIGVADDALIPFIIIAVTTHVIYQNREEIAALIAQMNLEIDRILEKAGGPQGIQYSLRARVSGEYPDVRGGTTYLNAGDVWKYGETTDPEGRYSQPGLKSSGLKFLPEYYGNQVEIKVAEKVKIYSYLIIHGELPPGNRIRR